LLFESPLFILHQTDSRVDDKSRKLNLFTLTLILSRQGRGKRNESSLDSCPPLLAEGEERMSKSLLDMCLPFFRGGEENKPNSLSPGGRELE
jgi:hypothetical protein